MYQHDRALAEPYDATLGARLNDATFKALEGGRIFDLARKIQQAGNRAVHESKGTVEAGGGRDRLGAVPVLPLVRVHLRPLVEA